MRVLLVNPNRLLPPIAPIGLEYVATALLAAGHRAEVLDLTMTLMPQRHLDRRLAAGGYDLLGLSIRNTDDCYYPGKAWFLPPLKELVARIRRRSSAPIVVGGAGFSAMPEAIVEMLGVDYGIRGEGEFAMVRLANGERDFPDLVTREDGQVRVSEERSYGDLASLPPMSRRLVDNLRYYRYGGQVGFETKRGCAAGCTFCVDPLSKGDVVRVRPPEAIAFEVGQLVGQGVRHLHTCDSEFNVPLGHAIETCEAIIEAGLGSRMRWYAYCSPRPFTDELAQRMRQAGCVGLLLGADHLDAGMLKTLGRRFQPDDVARAVEACHRAGITTHVSLMLGGPGETRETVRSAIAAAKELPAEIIGVAAGMRVFPGTPAARQVPREELHGWHGVDDGLVKPVYYRSAAEGDLVPYVQELTKGDPRFILSYVPDWEAAIAPWLLMAVILAGQRGAHWDIVRKIRRRLPGFLGPRAPK